MAESDALLVRCSALTQVTRGIRASLDAGGRRGESMDMENRIAVLERDVRAIKSELAVIRHDHADATALGGRLQRVEFEITQLQTGVSQLTADVLQVKEEVVSIRIELARLSTVQAECATKAEVKALEANIKGWMLVITMSIMTSVFAMIYPLYGLLKPAVAMRPVPAPQAVAPVSPPPADST